MKENKQIRKVLCLGKSNIALVVLEESNILFANQVEIDPASLQAKVSELLTNAANWLGFNIKDVEIIFDDPSIERITYTNQEFVDCNNEEDIAKEIFKIAKINNQYVNEINFMGITYDEIEHAARVNCQICVSSYITYKKYIKAVRACNVVVTNTTNLYRLLKPNKDQIELSIKVENEKAIACEYYGTKLNQVKIVDLKINDVYQHLADKFGLSLNKVEEALAVANQLVISNDLDVDVVSNYNLRTKSFNKVKAQDFVALYRDEIRTQINNFVDFRLFQNVSVVSNDPINALEGFNFINNEEIGFDNVSLDKILALSNIDANKEEITQFGFENKLQHLGVLA